MKRSWFVAGTDTGVGKTLVALGLLHAARAQGMSTLGLKPVAAGCVDQGGLSVNDDAWALMQTSSTHPDYAEVNPVLLQEAMAPHIAAEREGRTLTLAPLVEHCNALLTQADFCVVEGAGGWQVPLNAAETMADLAVALNRGVILVVGMRLGCINHALLTAEAIRGRGLPLSGWVANHVDPRMLVADENVAALAARLDAPLLGRIPNLTAATPEAAAACLHLKALLS